MEYKKIIALLDKLIIGQDKLTKEYKEIGNLFKNIKTDKEIPTKDIYNQEKYKKLLIIQDQYNDIRMQYLKNNNSFGQYTKSII